MIHWVWTAINVRVAAISGKNCGIIVNLNLTTGAGGFVRFSNRHSDYIAMYI